MDINKLTQKSQEALAEAQSIATRMGHIEVDGEHLLMALIDQPEGLVPRLLDQAGADTAALRADLERELNRRPKVSGPGATPGQVSVTRRLANLLEAAEREAKRLKDEYVSVEHLVMAIAEEGSAGAAGRMLASHGVTPGFLPGRADQGPRQPASHFSVTGRRLRGAGEVRPRPGRRGPRRQVGSGDRPRRRDPQGDSDPQPQDEEQSGTHR